jgi:hypothetical protein
MPIVAEVLVPEFVIGAVTATTPDGPIAPVLPVVPVSPFGRTKPSVCDGAVPVIEALADEPDVTVPMLRLLAGPVAPVSPLAPVGPVAPVAPVSPLAASSVHFELDAGTSVAAVTALEM